MKPFLTLNELVVSLFIIGIIAYLLLLGGCVEKSVNIYLYDNACLLVDGNITPSFEREGTTENANDAIDFNLNKNSK